VVRIDEKPSITTSYYVSSGELPPEIYAKCIREHWFIENKLHHVKDATFREDFTVKRVNARVFSIIADFAINILKSHNIENMRKAICENSLNFQRFFQNYATSLNL
jgi:predicted transposase YbfD/YdcC